jgi:hypothetical protein
LSNGRTARGTSVEIALYADQSSLYFFVATFHIFAPTLPIFVTALTIVTTYLKHFEPALFLQYNLNSAGLFNRSRFAQPVAAQSTTV